MRREPSIALAGDDAGAAEGPQLDFLEFIGKTYWTGCRGGATMAENSRGFLGSKRTHPA